MPQTATSSSPRSRPGRFVAKRLGLPESRPLRRFEPGQPALAGPALIGGDGRMGEVLTADAAPRSAPSSARSSPTTTSRSARSSSTPPAIADSAGLQAAVRVLPRSRSARSARAGGSSCSARRRSSPTSRRQAVAQRALEGFVRSAAKELRERRDRHSSCYVAPGAEANAESTLRFLLSAKSAYVSGQVIRIGAGESTRPAGLGPAAGRAASRSSPAPRAASARRSPRTLARDGAHVVGVDVPAQGEDLTEVVNEVGGSSLLLDITDEDAPDAARRAPARAPRRRRRRRPQRRRHARPHARADVRGRVGPADRDQPDRAGADQRDAARRRRAAAGRADRHRLVDERHRRQPRPGELRDLEGGRDRHRRVAGAGARRARPDDQRGRARASSRRR